MVVRLSGSMRVALFHVLAVLADLMCSAIVALDGSVPVPPESTPDALDCAHPALLSSRQRPPNSHACQVSARESSAHSARLSIQPDFGMSDTPGCRTDTPPACAPAAWCQGWAEGPSRSDAKRPWWHRAFREAGLSRWHWVVEWQRRGTPHLHLAVYAPPGCGSPISDIMSTHVGGRGR